MSTDTKSIAWYDEHADGYMQHVRNTDESIYHSLYEKPAMYGLLPGLRSMSVISLGCGSGEDCHYLSGQGAARVEGIDISSGMIAIAKKSYAECQFKVMDMEHLTYDDASFDFAYSSLAIHYIEDWTKVFGEVYRILKPGAYFLFSCNHPVASAMKITSDDGNVKVSELSRIRNCSTDSVTIVGDYLGRQALTREDGLAVTTWHKAIGEISQEAAAAGFMIANICEPKPLERMKEISPHDYDTLVKIPSFAVFKLWKPAA